MGGHRQSVSPDTRDPTGDPTAVVHNDDVRRSAFEVSEDRAERNEFKQLRVGTTTTANSVCRGALDGVEVNDCAVGRTAQHPVEPHHADSPNVNLFGRTGGDDTQRMVMSQFEKCFAQVKLGSTISFNFSAFIENGVLHFRVPQRIQSQKILIFGHRSKNMYQHKRPPSYPQNRATWLTLSQTATRLSRREAPPWR